MPGGYFFFSLCEQSDTKLSVFSLLSGSPQDSKCQHIWAKMAQGTNIFLGQGQVLIWIICIHITKIQMVFPWPKNILHVRIFLICKMSTFALLVVFHPWIEYIPVSCFQLSFILPAGAQRSAPATGSLCVRLPKTEAPPDWRFENAHGAMSDWMPPLSAGGCSHLRRTMLQQWDRWEVRKGVRKAFTDSM